MVICGFSYLSPKDIQQSFRTYFKDGISTNLRPFNSEFEVLISHVIIVHILDTLEMQ